jgi:4-hydroxy-3-methylbut-2-en-1-yl diphosphate synthase IspG/GcpE
VRAAFIDHVTILIRDYARSASVRIIAHAILRRPAVARRTAKIKAATSHLKGVKITIIGCIVNGPGEMADADFGYVGGAPGKVNLYIGKTAVKFNIPEAEAVDRLQDLIREHAKWVEPAQQTAALETVS